MSERTKLSYAAATILRAIASGYRYGFDVMDVTGLPSGTVYPALRRMEDAGLVVSRWEDADVAQQALRPARKYYEITDSGGAVLAEALKKYRALEGLVFEPRPGAEPAGG